MIKCRYCKKNIHEISSLKWQAEAEEMTVEDFVKDDLSYDEQTETFECMGCYIKRYRRGETC